MGRAPCCDKANVKRGPWSPEEDATLKNYVESYGTGGNWIALPQKAGLKRCGKSCRLRWLNYLRPDIKHGGFTEEEDNIICTLYSQMGSRWSLIASQLPGRTDNDVKNYWNTKLKKKLLARKTSFNLSKNIVDNIGFLPAANTNVIIPTDQPAEAASQPCLPKAETYNLDYSTSSQSHVSATLPILSHFGYGVSVSTCTSQNLPLDSVMHFPRPEAVTHLSQSGATLENSHIVSSSQEGSCISDSTNSLVTESKSVSMPAGNGYHVEDHTGNILIDDQFNYEFPYEFVNGIWGQEKASEVGPSCSDSLADFSHDDIKPEGLNRSVANRY